MTQEILSSRNNVSLLQTISQYRLEFKTLYTHCQNMHKTLLKCTKRDYYRNRISQALNKNRKMWSIVNEQLVRLQTINYQAMKTY